MALCIAEFRGPWHLKDEGKKRKDYGKVKYLLPDFLRANSILFKLLSQDPFFLEYIKKAKEECKKSPRPRNLAGAWRYVTAKEFKLGYLQFGEVHKLAVDLWLPGKAFRLVIDGVVTFLMTIDIYVYLKLDVRGKKRVDPEVLKERPHYPQRYPELPDL